MSENEFDIYCQKLARKMGDPILLSSKKRYHKPNSKRKDLTDYNRECILINKFFNGCLRSSR